MEILLWILAAIVSVAMIFVIVLYFTARYFYRFTILRKPTATLESNINANTNWSQYLDFLGERSKWLGTQTLEKCEIVSDDGLKLCGYILKSKKPSKKFVICFHGYTSKGLSNFGSYAKFYNDCGVNMLMVDARAHGESEGEYIGFGVLDRYDALKWINYVIKTYGADSEIYLHGVSMGGATVLMTSGLDLPENVMGIIADCAFTSAYDVFTHILKRDYHLPKFPLMSITEKMTKRHAGYGYNDVNTLDEVAKTKVPVLFIHGDKDDFVPTYMTEQNYKACNSKKKKLIIENADHAESYFRDRERYESCVREIMNI